MNKYKYALNKAKKLMSTSVAFDRFTIESIFPELKESEDERIRKALVDYFTAYKEQKECGIKTFYGIPTDNIIAWLEKQGEQKPVDKVEPKFKVKYAGNEYNVFDVKDIAGVTYYGIEDEPNHIDYVLPDNCEIVSEQKLADKVEPKFKAEDWIVRELDNSVHQVKAVIENISNGKYGYDLTKGGYISSQDANFYHLWTILDANDGDVIYTPKGLGVEGIFLVSGWQQIEGTGKTLCSYIGYRVDDDEIVEGGLGAIWWKGVVDTYYPATKEQRELLFHKMKEAGYEWDVDKKELKKIKDETEIPFGAKDSELQEDTYYIPKGFHAEIDEDKVVIKKGELHIRKLESLVKQIWATAEHENDKDTIHKMSNLSFFLKTLKPQLKQEWSEEDEYCIHQLIVFCENCMVQDAGAKRCAHWLKSLKERYTWKPSDEQMITLRQVISGCSYDIEPLVEIEEYLKKLRGE